MAMIPAINTIGKPIDKPIMHYSNGQLDTELHPFTIVAMDDNNVYAFAMTSSISQLNQTIVSDVLYYQINPNNVNYTNNYYAKDSSINCSNLHMIPKEALRDCKNIAILPQSLRYELMKHHVFAQNEGIAKKDELTDQVISLMGQKRQDIHFSDTYKKLQQKCLIDKDAKLAMQRQRDRIKQGILSTEKTTYIDMDGKVNVKSIYETYKEDTQNVPDLDNPFVALRNQMFPEEKEQSKENEIEKLKQMKQIAEAFNEQSLEFGEEMGRSRGGRAA